MQRKPLIIAALALLVLASPVTAQSTGPPQNHCTDETKYDRFTDLTTVVCGLLELPDKLDVNLIAEYHGTKITEPPKISLSFYYWNKNASRFTKPQYEEAETLYLLSDASRMEISVSGYKFHNGIIGAIETADAVFTDKQLGALLTAQTLEGRWGHTEFKFSKSDLDALQDFIKRQRPK